MKKYIWLPPTKGVGSGKISRRVRIVLKTEDDQEIKFRKRKQPNFYYPKIGANAKGAIKYTSPEARIIFSYWQRLGFPFVKHLEKKNKTTTKAMRLIEKYVKKYSKNQIIHSMSTIQILFNASWFKYRILYASKKLSLPDFFEYDKNSFPKERRKDIPRSWFKECKKPLEILEERYGVKRKVKHPRVTEILTDAWKKYSGGRNLTQSTKNRISFAAEKYYSFCQKNKLDILMIVDTVDKMINDWKTYKPKKITWLCSENFIQDTLPEELLRAKIIDRKDKEGLKF